MLMPYNFRNFLLKLKRDIGVHYFDHGDFPSEPPYLKPVLFLFF